MIPSDSDAKSEGKIDDLCINTLRFLSVDMVEKAKSGHPGLPLGAAPMAYVLWKEFLKFNPKSPQWADRDRFILSAGHGCALLYSLLHVTGYDLTLDDLKNFRQWGSKTPGHPEVFHTPGVEATTGPLGQGFANGVGMAIAEQFLAARFNRPDFPVVDHHTYVLASDGDLMEGVASEAASLAGHLRLGKLVVLYDDNHISIEGETELTFTEDVLGRFKAYGWHTQRVEDGNDLSTINQAIAAAKSETERPSIIAVRTHIGFGSPKQDSAGAHGEPLGAKDTSTTKEKLHWPKEPAFYVPEQAAAEFSKAIPRGEAKEATWRKLFAAYESAHSELAKEFRRVYAGELPPEWTSKLPTFKATDKPLATREASGKVLNALAAVLPELVGGSADLGPSTKTMIEGGKSFEPGTWDGRNFHFGIREHAMGSVMNGMSLHRGLRPFGATFLVFSDYMRPPIRLAALNGVPVIYIFTHDSIGLGEDGPTHQPVEQILGLRSIPGMVVLRPADPNETSACWKYTIDHGRGPVALILTRQKVPTLDLEKYPAVTTSVARGGYVLSDAQGKTDLVLVATGSEVHLALSAQEALLSQRVNARVVSMPSWELFRRQDEKYRRETLGHGTPRLGIEAGTTLGWNTYAGDEPFETIGVDKFGASAPGEVALKHYGFNVDNVCQRALALLKKER